MRETLPETVGRGASPKEQKLYDSFGRLLLEGGHPVLLAYLRQRERYIRELRASMAEAGTRKAQGRLGEFEGELADIGRALSFFEGKGYDEQHCGNHTGIKGRRDSAGSGSGDDA